MLSATTNTHVCDKYFYILLYTLSAGIGTGSRELTPWYHYSNVLACGFVEHTDPTQSNQVLPFAVVDRKTIPVLSVCMSLVITGPSVQSVE